MNEENPKHALATNTADYVAMAAKAALGGVPFAGSLLAEIAGTIVPNQRIERIVQFAQELASRLSGLEENFVRSQLTNENFTDLMEEGLRQAARAVSEERRAYIAALISNSLSKRDISYAESRHLLRVLGELNDIEIIRLGSHLHRPYGPGDDYWRRHENILTPVGADMGSPQTEVDKQTLQESYDAHLTQLGLLSARYVVDMSTKQPKFDSHTGVPKVRGHEITSLGRLLLRQVGISADDDAG